MSYSIVQNGEGGIDTNDNGDVEWGEVAWTMIHFFAQVGIIMLERILLA